MTDPYLRANTAAIDRHCDMPYAEDIEAYADEHDLTIEEAAYELETIARERREP